MRPSDVRRRSLRARLETDDGAVMVVVAITLSLLMAVAALAIDAGRGMVERSSAQNAADHAALAAAYVTCTGGSEADAELAALASAARNRFDDSADPVTVNVVQVGGGWQAHVRSEIHAPFGSVIGQNTLVAATSAVATCTPGQGFPYPGAVFAGGTTCPTGTNNPDLALWWDADDVVVNGSVHSNGSLWVDGDGNRINDGTLTYVNNVRIESGNPNLPTPEQVGAVLFSDPYPIGHFDPTSSDFGFAGAPNFYYYDVNEREFSKSYLQNNPGVHVVRGRLTPTSGEKPAIHVKDDAITANITLVSLRGTILLDGDGHRMTHYLDDGLLFYAPMLTRGITCNRTGTDENADIRLEDDDGHYTGIALAPKGRIWVDGADDFVINGAVVGYAVTLQGDKLTFNDTAFGSMGDPDVSISH